MSTMTQETIESGPDGLGGGRCAPTWLASRRICVQLEGRGKSWNLSKRAADREDGANLASNRLHWPASSFPSSSSSLLASLESRFVRDEFLCRAIVALDSN